MSRKGTSAIYKSMYYLELSCKACHCKGTIHFQLRLWTYNSDRGYATPTPITQLRLRLRIASSLLGYVTSTEKPAGFRSRVLWVRVRYPNLYTCEIPCTRA